MLYAQHGDSNVHKVKEKSDEEKAKEFDEYFGCSANVGNQRLVLISGVLSSPHIQLPLT